MNQQTRSAIRLPVYAHVALALAGLYLFVYMLSAGREIMLPLIYAAVTAVVLSPAVRLLTKRRVPRVIAVSLILFLASLVALGLLTFISIRISTLDADLPQLLIKFETLLDQLVHWISEHFNIRERKVDLWLTDSREELMDGSNQALGITLAAMGGILSAMILTPVYIFLMLFYAPHFTSFAHQLFARTSMERVNEVLAEMMQIIKSYLSGLLIQFVLVSGMNIGGLLLLGIEYAVLLGILGGLLNLIPYLGGIVTMLMFAAIALVTKPPIYVLYIVLLYGVIQFIDNNIIVIKVLGSKVKLNAFVSLVAVVAGGMLWGVPGMFLSIPLVAIIKLVLDLFESLKPWGFLMGEPEKIKPEEPKPISS